MIKNPAASKRCRKCKAQEIADFYRCPFCDTTYDAHSKERCAAQAEFIANLPYAAPGRRFIGHVLDGILGTLIVGSIWIGLCLTGAVAIVQSTVDQSIAANFHSNRETAPSKLTTQASDRKRSRYGTSVHKRPHETAEHNRILDTGVPGGVSDTNIHHHAVDTNSHNHVATANKLSSTKIHNQPAYNRVRAASGVSKSKRKTADTETQPKQPTLPFQDLVGDWLPGYDGNGLNASLQFPVLVFTMLWYVLMLFYTASFQAGPWQATPGQALVGCRVTDACGNPITFGRASMRYCASLLSNCFGLLGYLPAFLTPRNQTLHDMISDCLVLRR